MAARARTPSVTDWIAPWVTMTEIALTAPWVVGYRTVAMLADGWPPSERSRREYARMWTEKAEAFTRAAVAAATGAPGPATTARTLAPVRDRVRGNARRLTRV